MKILRNKNAPPLADLVQEYIGTAYDVVKAVYDNLDMILAVGQAIEDGDLENFLADTDIDTLAKLNAIVADATLLDEATLGTAAYEAVAAFATAAQGALANTALQPADLNTLAKLNALVLDQTVASQAYVDLAVAGLYDHKGSYNAASNTPDLDTAPSGIKKADAYTVSVAGTFYTAVLAPGDVLIADKDDPTLETDWTIINRNIDETAFATAAQGSLADSAVQPADLGTAAAEDVGAFATSGQGALADSATQPGDNISTLVNDSGFTDDQTGAEIKVAYELELDTNAFTDTEKTKLGLIESSAKDDQTGPEIESLYNSQVAVVSQVDAEAGTSTTVKRWTAERVAQAIAALSGGGASLSAANEWTKTQNFNATTLTDAANISWDLESNQVCSVTLTDNRTLDNPTNMKDGATYILRVIQDAGGTNTLAYGSAYKWAGGTAPVITATGDAIDILTFVSDGTNMYGTIVQDFS